MAKGRKLTTSRRERLLGTYGLTAGDSPEFDEDEIWSVVSGGDEPHRHNSHDTCNNPCTRIESGLTLAFEDQNETKMIVHKIHARQDRPRGPRHVAASAPVNVPDWTNIYRVDSVELLGELKHVYDDDEYEVVPPHEYVAREYRRIAANSVFEGAGRTLKGRDMSRVRDSVWGQTGFDG